MGFIVNLFIRLSLIYFLGEVMFLSDDPRFAGKAIPIRNLIIVISFSLLIPLLYYLKKRGLFNLLNKLRVTSYPWWYDNLYLSIFWLDMAGNSFNLYDTYYYFDLIPHFHSPGAVSGVIVGLFGLPALSAVAIANIIHTLLEAQEYYTDVFFKTHNVRGVFDAINDLLAGIFGSIIYAFIAKRMQSKK